MRKLIATVAMFFLLGSVSLLAQAAAQSSNPDQSTAQSDKQAKKTQKAEKKEAKAAQKGKDMRLTGWVREEGGKTVFVNDKDKQTWDVSNPDSLKGHEGHHVRVNAKIDEAAHSLTIDKVSMMRKGKQTKEAQEKKG